eukprot:TRINITY_DN15971_c0_g1_i1.p1 TRINITY_DN15971_c0_g1~~TRINITY_DN15971_c0_g1_i1.p1  ORF type:complete len:1190 (+),score=248.97 TRINITY_DN15971_c0_g1_i1:131-3700(+)
MRRMAAVAAARRAAANVLVYHPQRVAALRLHQRWCSSAHQWQFSVDNYGRRTAQKPGSEVWVEVPKAAGMEPYFYTSKQSQYPGQGDLTGLSEENTTHSIVAEGVYVYYLDKHGNRLPQSLAASVVDGTVVFHVWDSDMQSYVADANGNFFTILEGSLDERVKGPGKAAAANARASAVAQAPAAAEPAAEPAAAAEVAGRAPDSAAGAAAAAAAAPSPAPAADEEADFESALDPDLASLGDTAAAALEVARRDVGPTASLTPERPADQPAAVPAAEAAGEAGAPAAAAEAPAAAPAAPTKEAAPSKDAPQEGTRADTDALGAAAQRPVSEPKDSEEARRKQEAAEAHRRALVRLSELEPLPDRVLLWPVPAASASQFVPLREEGAVTCVQRGAESAELGQSEEQTPSGKVTWLRVRVVQGPCSTLLYELRQVLDCLAGWQAEGALGWLLDKTTEMLSVARAAALPDVAGPLSEAVDHLRRLADGGSEDEVENSRKQLLIARYRCSQEGQQKLMVSSLPPELTGRRELTVTGVGESAGARWHFRIHRREADGRVSLQAQGPHQNSADREVTQLGFEDGKLRIGLLAVGRGEQHTCAVPSGDALVIVGTLRAMAEAANAGKSQEKQRDYELPDHLSTDTRSLVEWMHLFQLPYNPLDGVPPLFTPRMARRALRRYANQLLALRSAQRDIVGPDKTRWAQEPLSVLVADSVHAEKWGLRTRMFESKTGGGGRHLLTKVRNDLARSRRLAHAANAVHSSNIFWRSLRPSARLVRADGTAEDAVVPTGEGALDLPGSQLIAEAIRRRWGSYEAFRREWLLTAEAVSGRGWVWLVWKRPKKRKVGDIKRHVPDASTETSDGSELMTLPDGDKEGESGAEDAPVEGSQEGADEAAAGGSKELMATGAAGEGTAEQQEKDKYDPVAAALERLVPPVDKESPEPALRIVARTAHLSPLVYGEQPLLGCDLWMESLLFDPTELTEAERAEHAAWGIKRSDAAGHAGRFLQCVDWRRVESQLWKAAAPTEGQVDAESGLLLEPDDYAARILECERLWPDEQWHDIWIDLLSEEHPAVVFERMVRPVASALGRVRPGDGQEVQRQGKLRELWQSAYASQPKQKQYIPTPQSTQVEGDIKASSVKRANRKEAAETERREEEQVLDDTQDFAPNSEAMLAEKEATEEEAPPRGGDTGVGYGNL